MKCFSLLQRLSVLLLVGVSVSVFQSCCDYEDEVANIGNSSSIKVGEIVPGSDKRILEVGDNKYYYTSKGELDYIKTNTGYLDFSSNSTIVNGYDESKVDDYLKKTNLDYTLSFNEKGYISKATELCISEVTNTEIDFYQKFIDSLSCHYYYDNEGHLVNMVGEGKGFNGVVNYEITSTMNLKWHNGLLTKVEVDMLQSLGVSISYIFEFFYDEKIYSNKYYQYAYTTCFDYLGSFAPIGLLGKGSKFLPEKVVYTNNLKIEFDSGVASSNESNTYTFSYEFNEDGTIYCVKTYGEYEEDNSTDYYTYGTYEDQLNMDESETKSTRSGKRVNRNFLFGKYFMR